MALSANRAAEGGAIFNLGGRVVIVDSELTANRASDRGGAIHDFSGLVTVERSEFRENQATVGGAFFHEWDRVTVRESCFVGNQAAEQGGAFDAGSLTELTKVTLTKNSAGSTGGAIQVSLGTPLASECLLAENSAGRFGGAVGTSAGQIELKAVRLAGNSSGGRGGGLSVSTTTVRLGHPVVLADCDFERNAAVAGGAISLNGASLRAVRCSIAENTALETAGGIAVEQAAAAVEQCAIYCNQARDGGALSIEAASTQARLVNVTLSGNRASRFGAAVFAINGLGELSFVTANENVATDPAGAGVQTVELANLWVRNAIFANTSDGMGSPRPDCAGEVFSLGGSFSTGDSCPGFTAVQPRELRLGRLRQNPPGRTPTHALMAGSAAIDGAADCLDTLDQPVKVDQRGVQRPQGAACDSGAYERGQTAHKGGK